MCWIKKFQIWMANISFNISLSFNLNRSEVLVNKLPSLVTHRLDYNKYGRGYFNTLKKLKGNNENLK